MTFKTSGEYTPDIRSLNDRLIGIERKIDEILLTPLGQLAVTYVEPPKPREGYYVLADGTQWNPGSGKGVYIYDGSAWVQWVAL